VDSAIETLFGLQLWGVLCNWNKHRKLSKTANYPVWFWWGKTL